jgi:acetyltransferase-like isoleucine patch superfamily enzyme
LIKFIKLLISHLILSLPFHPYTNKLRVFLLKRKGYIEDKESYDFSIAEGLFIKGKVYLGSGININRNVMIASSGDAKIKIGENVMIGPNVVIRNSNHGFSDLTIDMKFQPKNNLDIIIKRNCWIASNCTILAGVELEEGVIVAAGSVVKKGKYPKNIILGGVPAKIIKVRSKNEISQENING